MRELYSPAGEMELLILRSVLDDAGIPYFVRNEIFGSLYGACFAEAHNRKTVCVPETAWEEAVPLLDEFLHRTGRGAELAELASEPPLPRGPFGRLVERLLAWAVERFGDEEEDGAPQLSVIRGERSDGEPSDGERPRGARRPELRLVKSVRSGRRAAGDATTGRTPRR
jgi:hypothetical protein